MNTVPTSEAFDAVDADFYQDSLLEVKTADLNDVDEMASLVYLREELMTELLKNEITTKELYVDACDPISWRDVNRARFKIIKNALPTAAAGMASIAGFGFAGVPSLTDGMPTAVQLFGLACAAVFSCSAGWLAKPLKESWLEFHRLNDRMAYLPWLRRTAKIDLQDNENAHDLVASIEDRLKLSPVRDEATRLGRTYFHGTPDPS